MTELTIGERMRMAGIVQEGDPLLTRPARRFEFPVDRIEAQAVVAALDAAADRVTAIHEFAKGVGVAAPQIGLDRAAAVVRLPDGRRVVLLNPDVVEESGQTDVQFEGCLSLFDVRCRAVRSRMVRVAHEDFDGNRRVSTFRDGAARLVLHEVDHLRGVLLRERLLPGEEPIPLSQYRGTGMAWQFREG